MKFRIQDIASARAWLLGFVLVIMPGVATAANFEVGEVDISTSTTLSLGASIRTSEQGCRFVAVQNGGCVNELGVSHGLNNDDGNINTEAWEPISTTAKITAEADISWQNVGMFVRGSAFFDHWGDEKVGTKTTRFGSRPLKDNVRGDDARDAARSDAEILDAFVYGSFEVADTPFTVRLGRQVVNWGESLFIPGGVNSYLPIDIAALRTPGAEVKEALKPEPSVYASVGLPFGLSLEGFYVFGFEKSDLNPCGTFFAGHDGYCDGGAYVVLNGEFPTAPVVVPRTFDRDADDQGQFGLALRYYADWLNDGTELAFYFNRYHSKLPIATFTSADASLDLGSINPGLAGNSVSSLSQFCGALLGGGATFNTCSTTPVPGAGGATALQLGIVALARTKEAYAVYVEDIETVGASFNTLIDLFGGTALAGEFAYTPNMPFQIADPEINANDLENFATDDFAAGLPDGTLPNNTVLREGATIAASGTEIRGYDNHAAMTAQFQTTSTFASSNPIVSGIGADTVILLSNVGAQHLPDLPKDARLATARSGAGHDVALADSILGQGVGFTNYADDFSWGYRLTVLAQYNNFFNTAWTVSPSLQYGHDVKGNAAGPIGPGFVENKKAITLGVTADLESTWRVGASYTNNFGAENYNQLYDKDFLSVNASYSF
ncbi:DUF1302 domain-containing protein [Pyruvatibacter sp.]|uniref:DUF1302 domain-containing protein n=1 Tax=Pyruvatibacter sp. TaxID=1981328 RepID=UPI003264B5C7